MKLKEKTQRKFVTYFEKVSTLHNGQDFELAYSDIQQETGAASVTLKKAIQVLAEEGIIEVQAGRNSRCARFRYLLPVPRSEESASALGLTEGQNSSEQIKAPTEIVLRELKEDVAELTQLVEHLRRRVRNQEMAIALLQDRIAELEDK